MKIDKINPVYAIFTVIFIIVLANLYGFYISFKRQRDIQRVLDLGNLEEGLIKYKSDFGEYPVSNDKGEIVACRGDKTDYLRGPDGRAVDSSFNKRKLVNLVPCLWGKDALLDAADPEYPAYLSRIPSDPSQKYGVYYKYVLDGKDFYLYAHLELRATEGYSRIIKRKDLVCGNRECNTVRTSNQGMNSLLDSELTH